MPRVSVRTARVALTVESEGKVSIHVDDRPPKKPAPLTLLMPDIPSVPENFRGQPYTINYGLVGDGDDNPKLKKSNRAGTLYKTWGLSLAPARSSGYQVCASASPGCVKACLFHQGHARIFPSISVARIAKTVALMEHRDWFEEQLRYELHRIYRYVRQRGILAAIRPNVLSDIMWERVFPWMFDYDDMQFYDYTKHVDRMLKWCRGLLPPNYHLTFSRSESNHAQALDVLRAGGNVAVVFRDKNHPRKWHNFRVENGDETDLRFLDPPKSVISLYAKGTAKQDPSGFVVNTKSARPSLRVVS